MQKANRLCIPAFHRNRVVLKIAVLNSHEIIEGTLDWKLDFGLIEGGTTTLPPLLKTRIFAHDELILVVAPGHHLHQAGVVNPEVLAKDELLLREQGSSSFLYVLVSSA